MTGSQDRGYQQREFQNRGVLWEDASSVADDIISVCGLGSVIDIGAGDHRLVVSLCERGVDAHAIDTSDDAGEPPPEILPDRWNRGSIGSLRLPDGAADTVVCSGCLEWLEEADLMPALGELFRIARKYFYLKVKTHLEGGIVRERDWWESRLLRTGFRKHARYYSLIAYDGLESEHGEIIILLEKSPRQLLDVYPLSALATERDLHMDMAREQGRRSDAHMIRYHEAAKLVRPGDRVVDAACGLGYGSHVLWHNSLAASVLGIDGSDYAIAYAMLAYADVAGRVRFRKGLLPEAIEELPEASVDFIVSFETLEHLENPTRFLRACARALTPGGRLMVSVPNDWSDETGADPNPHHFHVYEWTRLIAEVGANFLLESAYIQSASRKKSAGSWHEAPREWQALPVVAASSRTSEWCLLLAMRDPDGGKEVPYRERLFPATTTPPTAIDFSAQYENPWLVRSLVSIGPRMTDAVQREKIADHVLESTRGAADAAASLCVKAYCALEDRRPSQELKELAARFAPHTDLNDPEAAEPIAVRWAVSLLYVKALLELRIGDLTAAQRSFERCASLPFWRYSPLLATKTVDAAFRLGLMRHAAADFEGARRWWRHGMEAGEKASHADWEESLGNFGSMPDFAMREMTAVLDLTTRCSTLLSMADDLADRPVAMERGRYNTAQRVADMTQNITRMAQNIANMAQRAAELEAELQTTSGRLIDNRKESAAERVALNDVIKQQQSEIDYLSAGYNGLLSSYKAIVLMRDDTLATQHRQMAAHQRIVALLREHRRDRQKRYRHGKLDLRPGTLWKRIRGKDPFPGGRDRWLLKRSGLFDAGWYLAQNPDVLAAGVDPLEHYARHGGGEGRAPGPNFDSAAYSAVCPELALVGANPLLHFIKAGVLDEWDESIAPTLARSDEPVPPTPGVSASQESGDLAPVFKLTARMVAEAAKLEPSIAVTAQFEHLHTLSIGRSVIDDPVSRAWLRLFNSLPGPFDHLVFMPWLTHGGADLVAIKAVRAAIEKGGADAVLLVLTDYDRVEAEDWLPKNTQMRVLSDLGEILSGEDRIRLVEMLIFALRPRSVLNINSLACWEAFKRRGLALSAVSSLYAGLFCRDYLPDGRSAGYVDSHFRACLPALTKIYFDTNSFIRELIKDYAIPPSLQPKLALLRTPVSEDKTKQGFVRVSGRERLPVLWAGRLCRQKNPQIIKTIAEQADGFRFDVYGRGEDDYIRMFESATLSNLSFKGAYSSFKALPTRDYGVFLYTSLWDGLPTVLLDAAASGLPIVAADVGGISELVTSETGWLIKDHKEPDAYIKALKEIKADPEEAARRAARMLEYIRTAHSWDAYVAALSEEPSFLGGKNTP